MLAAAPFLFTHAVVTVTETCSFSTSSIVDGAAFLSDPCERAHSDDTEIVLASDFRSAAPGFTAHSIVHAASNAATSI